MTNREWLASDDPIALLAEFRARWRGGEPALERIVHAYLLGCCRAIWALLPVAESRRGVVVAERFVAGRSGWAEFGRAQWDAEGAAFDLDNRFDARRAADAAQDECWRRYEAHRRARIAALVRDVEAIPAAVLRRLVRPSAGVEPASPHRLLIDAAYFAHTAIVYPTIRPCEARGRSIERCRQFLSAAVLRDIVGKPSRRNGPSPGRPRPRASRPRNHG